MIVEDVRSRDRVAIDGLAGLAGQITRWLEPELASPGVTETDSGAARD